MSERKNVRVFSPDAEIFQSIIIIDADITEDSKIMDSPVESGIMISDHKINNPKEITLNCVLPIEKWEDAYKELYFWFLQSGKKFLMIQTKADVYPNMQLVALPHKETPETVSRLFFELRFREIKFVEPKYIAMPVEKVENPANAATVDAGKKQSASVKLGASVNKFFSGK